LIMSADSRNYSSSGKSPVALVAASDHATAPPATGSYDGRLLAGSSQDICRHIVALCEHKNSPRILATKSLSK